MSSDSFELCTGLVPVGETMQIFGGREPVTLASALDAAYNRDVDAPADTSRWFEHVETHGVERIHSELVITTDELSVHANSEERLDRTIATILGLDPFATLISETREPAGVRGVQFRATRRAP